MGKHRKVVLKDEQRDLLQRLALSHDNKHHIATKAQILLLTDRSQQQWMRDSEIIQTLGTSICTIVRIRRQFCEKGLDAVIGERPFFSRKPKFDKDHLQKTILSIITSPPDCSNRWTIKLLTDYLNCMDNPIPISQTLVHKTLQKMNIRLDLYDNRYMAGKQLLP